MKFVACIVFIVFLLFLFPVQATLLYSVSPWGIRPDLCLLTACLVGLWAGRVPGVIVGVVLGFIQSLFSASSLWLNLLTKAGAGFLAGNVTKHFSNMESPLVFFPVAALSLVWGIVFWLSSRVGTGEVFYSAITLLLPQAILDGLVAIGINWMIARWVVKAPVREGWVGGFHGGASR